MDYKKEYEAMVQRARELHEAGNDLTKRQMEIVCPELAESEDKRVNEEIRNFLIDMECKREWIAYLEKQKEQKPVHTARELWKDMRLEVYQQASGNRHESNYSDDTTKMFSLTDIDEIFEKIGDSAVRQKPAECIEDSVKFKEGFKAGRESGLCDGQKYVLDNLDSYGLCKSAEWSEEDKRKLNMLFSIVSQAADAHAFFTTTRLIGDRDAIELHNFLKSLSKMRPKKSGNWKPNKEQMEALNTLLCRGDFSYLGQHSQLQGLYNELKKL